MDAILFLPTTRCLHQNPRGETVYLATKLGRTANRATISFFPGPLTLGLTVFQADGIALPSLARDLLTAVREGRKVSGETLDYDDVKHICGALYGGTWHHLVFVNAYTHQPNTPPTSCDSRSRF
jgi:hypothetical protein